MAFGHTNDGFDAVIKINNMENFIPMLIVITTINIRTCEVHALANDDPINGQQHGLHSFDYLDLGDVHVPVEFDCDLHNLLALIPVHGGIVQAVAQDLGGLDEEGLPVARSLADGGPRKGKNFK